VVISCGATVIARHPRSYEREGFVFDPLHYLALLERKVGALDQAAPLVGWALPQFLDWLKRPFPGQGLYEYYRQLAQAAEQAGKPQPAQTVFARGSMEWLAAQKQAS
jgi:hypothetical protein